MKPLLCLLSCACLAGLAQTPDAAKPPTYVDPVLVYKAAVDYTPEAEAAKLQGTVYLYVEITPDGKTENIQVMQGLGLGLDEKAVQAVEQWRFKPGTRDGQPERVAQAVELEFRLPDAGPWRIRQASYTVTGKHTGVYRKPLLTRYARPNPAACPADGGSATVDLSIGEDGSPGDVKPRRPGDPVSAAAAKAIESWRFEPGQEDGKPRGANASIEFDCGPASTAAPDSSALRVGNWVLPPRVILKREPEYSKSARDARFQGSVTLGLIIDSTGHPVHLRVTQGAGLGLDEKALEAVSQWRFKPGMKDGQPVGVVVQVVVNFRLEER